MALEPAELRRVYDRMGHWLDTQSFYEDAGIDELVRHGRFEEAHRVFELGCGTGRLAERLLRDHLPKDATWRGVDLSPEMVRLSRERLAGFGPRAEVALSEGGPPAGEPEGGCDRFVTTYVLDLLPEDQIHATVAEAHRMLAPGGLLCAASLSFGIGPASRVVSGVWSWLAKRVPHLVGGCRPIELRDFLPPESWELRHHRRVVAFAVPCDAIVAARRPARELPGSVGR